MRRANVVSVVASALLLVGAGCGIIIAEPYVPPSTAVTQPAPQPRPPVVVRPTPQPPVAVPQVIIPKIVGSPLQVAEIILAGNQLRLGGVSHRQSPMAPGTVLTQSPLPGQMVSTGSRVSVVLALEKTRARVPAVTGKGVAQAALALRLAGLKTGEVSYVNMPGAATPRVVSQQPSAGLFVAPGTAVDLVVHTPAAKVRIPNLYGLTQIDAMNRLAAVGLELTGIRSSADPMAQPGTTISQSPAAGRRAEPGSGVSIVVSTGAGQVTVPNLVGTMMTPAVVELVKSGLRSQVVYENSPGMPNRILRQSPLAGMSVDRGTLVTLTVGRRRHTGFALVPQVVGVQQDLAVQALSDAGLAVGVVTMVPGTVAGRVRSQSPAAGARVRAQTAVNLVVTKAAVVHSVRVPNVVGMKRWAAQLALLGAGLKAGKITTVSGMHHNVVKTQSPSADATVSMGSEVDLTVYRWIFGSRMVEVPNIVGMNINQAEKALEKLSLLPGRVSEVPGPRPNVVMSQTPMAGSNVRTGTMIAISVATGRAVPQPQRRVTVPNVVGMQRGQAESAVRRAGLAIGAITEVNGAKQGAVVSQSPKAFARVGAGTAVNLNVARKRAPQLAAIVPNVTGISRGLAESRIRAAGLTVGTITEAQGPRPGRVMSQSPAASTRVARGSAVNLTVARRKTAGGLVSVPSVVGKVRAQAEAALRDAGLRVGTVTEVAGTAADTVLSQSPPANRRVRRNTPVNLTVVRKAVRPMVSVPNLVGKNRAHAEHALRIAKLRVGTVTEVSGQRQNIVVSQSPGAATRVQMNSAVNLTVSRKKAQTNTITVPSLTGRSRAAAEAELRRLGLAVGRISYVNGNDNNKVVSQSPAAGARVAKGSAVSLTVVKKGNQGGNDDEDKVTVPNLVGQQLARARMLIRRAGLRVGNYPRVQGRGKTVVKRQSPAAGTRAAKNSRVDLYVD